uniref:MADF domain-containing protein n=1 Tax=Caenorhabditis japonica TaxID=281687 RepID=A0A8R1DFI7_CAEJA
MFNDSSRGILLALIKERPTIWNSSANLTKDDVLASFQQCASLLTNMNADYTLWAIIEKWCWVVEAYMRCHTMVPPAEWRYNNTLAYLKPFNSPSYPYLGCLSKKRLAELTELYADTEISKIMETTKSLEFQPGIFREELAILAGEEFTRIRVDTELLAKTVGQLVNARRRGRPSKLDKRSPTDQFINLTPQSAQFQKLLENNGATVSTPSTNSSDSDPPDEHGLTPAMYTALIDMIREKPEVWKSSHPQKDNAELNEKIFEVFGKDLVEKFKGKVAENVLAKITPQLLRNTWETLRKRFFDEESADINSSWRFYQQLQFLSSRLMPALLLENVLIKSEVCNTFSVIYPLARLFRAPNRSELAFDNYRPRALFAGDKSAVGTLFLFFFSAHFTCSLIIDDSMGPPPPPRHLLFPPTTTGAAAASTLATSTATTTDTPVPIPLPIQYPIPYHIPNVNWALYQILLNNMIAMQHTYPILEPSTSSSSARVATASPAGSSQSEDSRMAASSPATVAAQLVQLPIGGGNKSIQAVLDNLVARSMKEEAVASTSQQPTFSELKQILEQSAKVNIDANSEPPSKRSKPGSPLGNPRMIVFNDARKATQAPISTWVPPREDLTAKVKEEPISVTPKKTQATAVVKNGFPLEKFKKTPLVQVSAASLQRNGGILGLNPNQLPFSQTALQQALLKKVEAPIISVPPVSTPQSIQSHILNGAMNGNSVAEPEDKWSLMGRMLTMMAREVESRDPVAAVELYRDLQACICNHQIKTLMDAQQSSTTQ